MDFKKHAIFVILFFFTNLACSQTPVVLWEQVFGNPESSFGSVFKTIDGDFLLSGSYRSPINENLMIRITSDNELVWEYDQMQINFIKKGIVQQSDGYFYSVRNFNPSIPNTLSLLQYDNNGLLTNQWSYPYSNVLTLTKLIATQDGGFLISGHKSTPESINSKNGWVAKINSSKIIEWTIEISTPDIIQLQTATQTTDGNFLVGGLKEYNNATSDFYLAKIDILGNIVWEKEYGGSENEDVWAVTELVNGNYIFAGASNSINADVSNNNGFLNVWTIITDTDGNLLSEKIVTNGFLSFIESSIIAEPDGGYTIGVMNDNCSESFTNYRFNIQRFNASNQNIWNFCLTEGSLYDIVKTDDDGYIAVGSITNLGISQAYAIKIGVVLDNESFALQNTSFYPNPANDILHIKSDIVFNHVIIYTVDGRKVMMEQIQNNQINLEKLPQNLYIAKLVTENEQEVNLKFVKN